MLEKCHHLRPEISYHTMRMRNLSHNHFSKYGSQRRDKHRRKVESKRVVLKESPVMIREQLPKFSSVHVQCTEESLEKDRLVKLWHFGRISSFTVYYPEYNIENMRGKSYV
jgi:hypothetical protein